MPEYTKIEGGYSLKKLADAHIFSEKTMEIRNQLIGFDELTSAY